MNKTSLSRTPAWFFPVVAALAISLGGCGSDGRDGAPGPQGPAGPSGAPTDELNITITSASISSAPVINFTATDQDGFAFTRLTLGDLRFTVAKLIPATVASPSKWQNYINSVQNATAPAAPKPFVQAVQGTRENNGTLVNNGNGTYRYTYGTNLTNLQCPLNAADPIAACTDGTGKIIDLSFNANLTHRVGVQTRGSLPAANATFDFVPAGGPVTVTREMVRTDACNVCHDKLEAHDARIDVKYCVTCHNPGSTDPDSGHSVDFKSMIHKIHYGADLPSVRGGTPFIIWGYRNTPHDFSDIHFPASVRSVSVGTPDLAPNDPKFIPASTLACTKCHNAADPKTPNAVNFTKANREACGACHDDIDFNETNPASPSFHAGGAQANDTLCATCHGPGLGAPLPGTVTKSHIIRERSAGACFKFNILNVSFDAGTRQVTVDFSVTNPNPDTHPNSEAFKCPATATYQIRGVGAHPEWTAGGGASRLVVDVGWNTADFNNANTPGTGPARTIEINALTTAVDLGGGTFQVVSPPLPLEATGSGQVAIEGHPAVQQDPTAIPAQAYTARVIVDGVVQAFNIDGASIVDRRTVVDVVTKCDRCHDVLSLHGSNRSQNGQLCVMCHNPSNTDIGRRPADPNPGTPDINEAALDQKIEESVDFRRLIHALHAAAKTNFDGTVAHGFRNKGLVVYGFGNRAHDFSHLRFPGALWKCQTCHLPDTYKLMDRRAVGGANWEEPAQNGILGSTIRSFGDKNPNNDLKISPTAAVCSSCHDSAVAQSHMELNGARFGVLQSVIATNVESCAVCHGPGRLFDVDFVHADGIGTIIPGP